MANLTIDCGGSGNDSDVGCGRGCGRSGSGSGIGGGSGGSCGGGHNNYLIILSQR